MTHVTAYASHCGPQLAVTLDALLMHGHTVTLHRITPEVCDELAYPHHTSLIVTVDGHAWTGYRPDLLDQLGDAS